MYWLHGEFHFCFINVYQRISLPSWRFLLERCCACAIKGKWKVGFLFFDIFPAIEIIGLLLVLLCSKHLSEPYLWSSGAVLAGLAFSCFMLTTDTTLIKRFLSPDSLLKIVGQRVYRKLTTGLWSHGNSPEHHYRRAQAKALALAWGVCFVNYWWFLMVFDVFLISENKLNNDNINLSNFLYHYPSHISHFQQVHITPYGLCQKQSIFSSNSI